MDALYVIYLSISGISLFFSLLLITLHILTGDYKINSFILIINVLISTALVSIGSLLTLTQQCKTAYGLQIICLTSSIIWISFINFLTASHRKIIWNFSIVTMVLSSYMIPTALYLIALFWFKKFMVLSVNEDYCQLYREYDYVSGMILGITPLLLMGYNIYMSCQSISYLIKINITFPFLKNDILQQRILPIILTVLLCPFFISFGWYNLEQDQDDDTIEIVVESTHILMQLGVLLIVLVYGINPTLQKTQVIRNLSKLRTKLLENRDEIQRQRISNKLVSQLSQQGNEPISTESELSHIDQTVRLSEKDLLQSQEQIK